VALDQQQHFYCHGFLLRDKTTAQFSGQLNFRARINLVFLMRQGAKMTASATQLNMYSGL